MRTTFNMVKIRFSKLIRSNENNPISNRLIYFSSAPGFIAPPLAVAAPPPVFQYRCRQCPPAPGLFGLFPSVFIRCFHFRFFSVQ